MNVTKEPHAPATLPLPPVGELLIPIMKLHGPQDLVWTFWTEKCFRAGTQTWNHPARNLAAVPTALSNYFTYLNYSLVLQWFV
jgi:hypothetical protein